jgi:hypothetical protein
MNLEFSGQTFDKNSNIRFHENLSSGSRVVSSGQTDGRTDMTKLIVAIPNFANAPKNISNLLICMSSSLGFHERYSDIYRGSKYIMGEGRISFTITVLIILNPAMPASVQGTEL